MDGTALAGSGLRGDRQVRYDLVGDHVAVLPDVTLGSLRRATWSPTNLCYAGDTPHEGCRDEPFSHRGVNEKQPLRGIRLIASDINSQRRLYCQRYKLTAKTLLPAI